MNADLIVCLPGNSQRRGTVNRTFQKYSSWIEKCHITHHFKAELLSDYTHQARDVVVQLNKLMVFTLQGHQLFVSAELHRTSLLQHK